MTATSFLVRPTPVFRDSYLEALREELRKPMEDKEIEAIADGFEAHLASLDHDGQTPFTDRGHTGPSVPSNTFWLVDGANFIGSVNIRARRHAFIGPFRRSCGICRPRIDAAEGVWNALARACASDLPGDGH